MQLTRDQALRAIREGDVVFAEAADGDGRLLLVFKATPRTFLARHVTTGTAMEFTRDGRARRAAGIEEASIVSVAPLPADQLALVLELDRRMRTVSALSELRLSNAEIQMLVTHERFYRAHPLPER